MQVFGSFNEMAAGTGQNIQGTMSVFNAQRIEENTLRSLERQINDLNRGLGWATRLIGGYREGNPKLTDAFDRLETMQDEIERVGYLITESQFYAD